MPSDKDFFTIFESLLANTSETSIELAFSMSSFFIPLLSNSFFILIKSSCLKTSISATFSMPLRDCMPFISTLLPSLIDMFRSCLIVPKPRLHFPVLCKREPIYSATSLACFGFLISADVATSISGMPSLSKP